MLLEQPRVRSGSEWPMAARIRIASGATCLALAFVYSTPARSAEFTIPANTASTVFDGESRGVRPGDVIEIAAGVHGPLTLRDLHGTAERPVVIRNASGGQAVVRRSSPASRGFVLKVEASRHFILDGSNIQPGSPGYPYGIKVTYASGATSANKDAPSAFLKTSGRGSSTFNNCTNFTIRSVQVDGGWPTYSSDGIGIGTNDEQFTTSAFPGARQENFIIERSDVRNVEGEGMYIGPNFYTGGVPLRNVVIRYNRVENTGWDGIQVKSAIEGDNLIHHNKLVHVGAKTSGEIRGDIFGISLIDGSGKIFNNYVESSGDTGIQHWLPDLPASYGVQEIEIYNNVVVDAGVTGAVGSQGISSGRARTNRNGQSTATTLPRIYHNTIVRPRGWGVAIGSESSPSSYIADNIIVEAGQGAIKAPSGVATERNRIGSVSQMQFADPAAMDFRLRAASPARDSAGDRFPPEDYDGVRRPIDGRADQGAFEYGTGAAPSRPVPPTISSVD